ncbi:MAG TPA: 30S ribosome-binding factor RbfA [Dehalococcoidia bacterium]|jgi:ribosome-binding factor A
MTRRIERINSVIQQEVSQLLRDQVNDPRLNSLISITRVETSADLRHTKIFISSFGEHVDKKEILEGFSAASGFLRCQLASRLQLRYMPDLSFQFDDSIERAAEVLRLIDKVSEEDTENKNGH